MKLICGGLWLALWVSMAQADMTMVQNLEISAMPAESGKGSAITMKMKGQKARIDFSNMLVSTIIDLKSKQLLLLDHKQKQVMAMPLVLMQSMLALWVPELTAVQGGNAAMQKTGKVQTINGYKCEEYAGSSGGTTMRCWLADTAEAPEMEPFRAYAQNAFKTTSYGAMATMKGLIVRSESTVLMNAKPEISRTELKSLSRAPVDDAVFNLPADYTVMGLPSFPMP